VHAAGPDRERPPCSSNSSDPSSPSIAMRANTCLGSGVRTLGGVERLPRRRRGRLSRAVNDANLAARRHLHRVPQPGCELQFVLGGDRDPLGRGPRGTGKRWRRGGLGHAALVAAGLVIGVVPWPAARCAAPTPTQHVVWVDEGAQLDGGVEPDRVEQLLRRAAVLRVERDPALDVACSQLPPR
jgi:hypothetical protein